MEELSALFHGFSVALTPQNLLLMVIGITLGVVESFMTHIFQDRTYSKDATARPIEQRISRPCIRCRVLPVFFTPQ